jgi:predicted Ser/Thr protein kinase
VTPDPGADTATAAERWKRIKDLFQHALEQPADRRRAWIAATIDDLDLQRDVDALVAAHETVGDFLEHPPVVTAAGVRPPGPGAVLGPYEIEQELGRGGAGVVYLAHDHRLGRPVALKLIAGGNDPELRDRLRREARAAATISHPAVATIYALEEFDGQLFIVSEYVKGRTLRALLADGPLPRDRALTVAREIAAALRAAHQAGVIHRDLKPENVMLSDDGAVKVVDFGIARVDDERLTQLTQHGVLLGTPAYMAPEQWLGTTADARADIYAFGIVVREMLSGRHPGLAVPHEARRPHRDGLTQIAVACSRLDPGERVQSSEALVRMLDGAAEPPMPAARWWWECHQAVTAFVYAASVWPAWLGRVAIGGSLGRIFFTVVLAAVTVGACLRLHLWFTARSYPAELRWVRRRSAIWITVADTLFALGLVSAPLLIREPRASIDVVLLAIGLGAAVSFLMIEPATTRAAFGGAD